MRHIDSTDRPRSGVVDYSAARARAIEWLGDRYLLAKPINRRFPASGTKGWQQPVTAVARS